MKRQTDHHGKRRWRSKKMNKTKNIYLNKIYIFCFILLFTSSSPCRKDKFTFSWFSVWFLFFLFPFLALVSRFSFPVLETSIVSCGLKEGLYISCSLSSQCQLNLMCHFSNFNSSFVRNDIIFRYIVKKCLVATVRKDGPESTTKIQRLPPLPLKCPIVDCAGLLILGRWRTDRLDHTVFEKEILKRLLVLAGYSW